MHRKTSIACVLWVVSLALAARVSAQAEPASPGPPAAQAPAEAAPRPAAPIDASSPVEAVPPAAPPAPAAPTAPALPAVTAQLTGDADRLDAVFAELAKHTQSSTAGKIIGVMLGGVTFGVGLYIAIDGSDFGDGMGRGLAGGVLIAIGTMVLADGIHSFSRETTDEQRLERFRAARAAGRLDRVELARYEGELHAETQIARHHRIIAGVEGIGMATGGVATMVIAGFALDFTDEGRLYTAVLGGTYFVMGTIQAFSSWTSESRYEELLRDYQAGAKPSPTVRVAPAIGASSLGFSLSGSF